MQTEQIGKYRVIARLGQGGMASVFLCVAAGPVGFNKLLVLKVLREELSHDSDFLTMFVNEARLAARLNHANVVQTYEVGFDGDRHFLAMDFLDGQPLHAVLRKVGRERMPLDVHVRILADMLAGLHYAHTLCDFDGTPLNVVHRDVSPQNVFVTYDGQIKLVDFGIAKAAGTASTTQSGVFKGKVSYIAPEQADAGPVDARADIFSVGVMLWEAMAGCRFAYGDNQTAILARRLSGRERRIREQLPDADPELANICDCAMSLEPSRRFASAQDFRDALEGFLHRFSRRVGSREVSKLMGEQFADEHARIRRIIDAQMKQLLRETSQTLPLPTIELSPGALDPTPGSTTIEGVRRTEALAAQMMQRDLVAGDSAPGTGSGSHGTLVGANLSATPARRGRSTVLIAGLGALAIGAVLAILVLVVGELGASRVAPAASTAANPEASGAPADAIRLAIAFGPAPAKATLDGVTLAQSPFFARVARDGSIHKLEVRAPGFVTQTTMLSYQRDIALNVVLEKEASPSGSSAAATPITPPTPRLGGPRPTGGGKQPLKIDEEDPYK